MKLAAVHLAVAFTASVLVTACSSITTSYDYNPNADFDTLRTFAWMPIRSNQLNQFELERVSNAGD